MPLLSFRDLEWFFALRRQFESCQSSGYIDSPSYYSLRIKLAPDRSGQFDHVGLIVGQEIVDADIHRLVESVCFRGVRRDEKVKVRSHGVRCRDVKGWSRMKFPQPKCIVDGTTCERK